MVGGSRPTNGMHLQGIDPIGDLKEIPGVIGLAAIVCSKSELSKVLDICEGVKGNIPVIIMVHSSWAQEVPLELEERAITTRTMVL